MQGYRREGTNCPGRPQVPWLIGILIAGMVAAIDPAGGQVIRGVVLDAAGQVPIVGTAVHVQATGGTTVRKATTDSAGTFVLSLPGAGLYTLVATRIGYVQHKGDTVRAGDSETVGVEIRLDRTAMPLRPLVVVERVSGLPDGFAQRRAAGFGRFLTRTDIEQRRGSRTTDLLRGMPGIRLVPARRGRGAGTALMMRGTAGLCSPAVWIDGTPLSDGGAMIDDLLNPSVLEAVEVFNTTTNAPIQYRTGTCGVVLFWTRRGQTEDRARIKWWKLALGATVGVGLVFLAMNKELK